MIPVIFTKMDDGYNPRVLLCICQDDTYHVAIARSAYRKEPHVIQELNIKKVPYAKWAWV